MILPLSKLVLVVRKGMSGLYAFIYSFIHELLFEYPVCSSPIAGHGNANMDEADLITSMK